MLVLLSALCCCFLDALWARQSDIDINRVRLLPNEITYPEHPIQHRNFVNYHHKRSNDHIDYSSRYREQSKPIQSLHDAPASTTSDINKVYQPREDPRLFYQSDAYIQEVNEKRNLNREVSAIYPGKEVIRAEEMYSHPMPLISLDKYSHRVRAGSKKNNLCVRCPQDRTLIAKPGSDLVKFQSPPLFTCSGLTAPREIIFDVIRGPKFGSLLRNGVHMVIGRVIYNSKPLQMCKMQVNVIVETKCPVPDYLLSECDNKTRLCNFSCRNPNLELHGHSVLSCGDSMGWEGWTGNLPICRAQSWCKPPPPPDHGRYKCKGATIRKNYANEVFSEGATCLLRCSRGWHWTPRSTTVCRRGSWTQKLSCQPKRQYTYMNYNI